MRRTIGVCAVFLLMLVSYGVGRVDFTRNGVGAADGDCQAFPQTGKSSCGEFLAYWNANGGLAQQGFPISDVFSEKSETDGNTYQVQYYERAVFEMHPGIARWEACAVDAAGCQKYKTRYNGTQPGGTPMALVATNAATGIVTTSPTNTVAVMASPTVVATATTAATATTVPTVAPTATAKPTATTAPVVARGTDLSADAYRARVQSNFGTLGGHALDIEDITVDIGTTAGMKSVLVDVNVSATDALYYLDKATKSDIQAWGRALLADLKATYPDTYVVANLDSNYYSRDYVSKTDCHYISDTYTSGQGWYQSAYIVRMSFIPGSSSGDRVSTCGGKS